MSKFDKFQPPDAVLDERDAARHERERIHKRRRNGRIKFIARVILVGAIPALLPVFGRHTTPVVAPLPVKAPRSVESPPYDNRPTEAPEGLSTIRLRRER